MNIDISPGMIFQAFTTLVLGGVGYMLRGILADFKAAIAKISEHEIAIALLQEKVRRLENSDQ